MLEETYHCDGKDCKNTTSKGSPATSWRVSTWLRDSLNEAVEDPIKDRRAKHFCSTTCERTIQ